MISLTPWRDRSASARPSRIHIRFCNMRGASRTYTAELQANPNIRVIANKNDFLLAAEDLAWTEATFASAQVTLFEHGGHLGNLSQPAVQQAIVGALDGLGACQSRLTMNRRPFIPES